tara:strand:- start:1010 stop:1480 length:471 start_codon:yes stop_codon:yes gene_type:complete
MAVVPLTGIARTANSLLNAFAHFLETEDNTTSLDEVSIHSLFQSDESYTALNHPIAEAIAQFLIVNKFEITTIPALVCVVAYAFFNRDEVLTATGAGKAFMAFLAGLAVPIGFVFGFAAYAPSQLNILVDFREYVLASGVMLLLLAATGIRKTIFP